MQIQRQFKNDYEMQLELLKHQNEKRQRLKQQGDKAARAAAEIDEQLGHNRPN
jgi:hypothetical protein